MTVPTGRLVGLAGPLSRTRLDAASTLFNWSCQTCFFSRRRASLTLSTLLFASLTFLFSPTAACPPPTEPAAATAC